jgi:hypothetical protein
VNRDTEEEEQKQQNRIEEEKEVDLEAYDNSKRTKIDDQTDSVKLVTVKRTLSRATKTMTRSKRGASTATLRKNSTQTSNNNSKTIDKYFEKENTATPSTSSSQQPISSNIASALVSSSTTNKFLASKSSSNLQKSKVLANTQIVNNQTSQKPSSQTLSKSKSSVDLECKSKSSSNLLISKLYPETVNSDQNDAIQSNPMPQLTWANSDDLWKAMRAKDFNYKHDAYYLRRHYGIEAQMRAILLDWLIEISYAYRLHRETLHLSIEYIDRFLTLTKQEMRIDRLQLIGICALYLAAKVEEIYPPKLKEFASHMDNYSANNEECMQKFELFMLKTLNWQISPCTCNTWLMTYLQIATINFKKYIKALENKNELFDFEKDEEENDDYDQTVIHTTKILLPLNLFKNSNVIAGNSCMLTKFYLESFMKSITLIDLCLFDMESLKYNYSVIAASSMYHMLLFNTDEDEESNEQQQNQENPDENLSYNRLRLVTNLIEKCTGYKLYELDSCIKWMFPFVEVCKEMLSHDQMCSIKQYSHIDPSDAHNIQLYYQYLDLLVS